MSIHNKFNGTKLRRLREAQGISQLELATKADVDQSLLSKYERGDVKNPPASATQALANSLNVDHADLFGEIECSCTHNPISNSNRLDVHVYIHTKGKLGVRS